MTTYTAELQFGSQSSSYNLKFLFKNTSRIHEHTLVKRSLVFWVEKIYVYRPMLCVYFFYMSY